MLLESLITAACLSAGPHVNTQACNKAITAASMQTGHHRLLNDAEGYYKSKAEAFAGSAGVFFATFGYMIYRFNDDKTIAFRAGYGLRLEMNQHNAGFVKEWHF